MMTHQDKCQLIYVKTTIMSTASIINRTKCENILGVHISHIFIIIKNDYLSSCR